MERGVVFPLSRAPSATRSLPRFSAAAPPPGVHGGAVGPTSEFRSVAFPALSLPVFIWALRVGTISNVKGGAA